MFVPSKLSVDQLETEIALLAGNLDAGLCRMLRMLAEFDRREGWSGFRSCAEWLSWRCGLSGPAAREHVRIARALEGLPLLTEAFERGTISYSKIRAITRIADETNEELLLAWSGWATAAQLETIVRAYRRASSVVDGIDSERMRARRRLDVTYDEEGMLRIEVVLDPEDGAVVMRALQAAMAAREDESVSAETEDGLPDPELPSPWQRRGADSWVDIAERYLEPEGTRDDVGRDRALIVVHTDEKTLKGPAPHLDDGAPVPLDALRRIACDAGVLTMGADHSIGRRTRVVPRAMRRALRARDRRCRAPGCTARRVDAHHIHHWIDGGETSMRNLIQLCRRHHGMVHAGRLHVRLSDDGAPVFLRGDGRALDPTRPPVPVGGAGLLQPSIDEDACGTTDHTRRPDYGLAVQVLLERSHPPARSGEDEESREARDRLPYGKETA